MMRRDLSSYMSLPAARALALAVFLVLGFIVYCQTAGVTGV